MSLERNYRGWLAAVTVTITLTLALMVVEKHLQLSRTDLWSLVEQITSQPPVESTGIHLEVDPGLVGSQQYVPNYLTALRQRTSTEDGTVASLLRRPPQPASSAVLREPLTAEDFVSLPLTQSTSSVELLMQSMDAALDKPVHTVSLTLTAAPAADDAGARTTDHSRAPVEAVGRLPEPTQLLAELRQLQQYLDNAVAGLPRREATAEQGHLVTTDAIVTRQYQASRLWIDEVQAFLEDFASLRSLDDLASPSQMGNSLLRRATALSQQSQPLADQLEDYHLAQLIVRSGYSLRRRAEVWNGIAACLQEPPAMTPNAADMQLARHQLRGAIQQVEALVSTAADRDGWRKYLLLDELTQWAQAPSETPEQPSWRAGTQLARNLLSRVYWPRLQADQQEFLQADAIGQLMDCLAAWSRDPVDYRQLLVGLEQIEQDARSRQVAQVAESIQVLRHSGAAGQRELAETLNTHYRNANLRLTISREMIERFLPEGQYEVRPVRQRILGAYTSGDSAVRTQLAVKLHPDPEAWHIELGVVGDVVSQTRSSKGPAVFHNSGTAQTSSQRLLRLTSTGYTVSSQPTQVESQDYLQKFSTNFDGLPVIGDFARLIVREQFDQKRGVARKLTQRKIASEVDQELDRKLDESLKAAEQELQQRILGPLERLSLDPMVVSMSTNAQRLSIRYRLASATQLSAYTPRPRAPADSLTSFQLHASVINNTIDRLGLGGRSWTLPELYQQLGRLFQKEMAPPDDIPSDISVRFADQHPISVELVDGQLRLHLRFVEFQRNEGLHIKNFEVTSSYLPLADGLAAGLVRDPDSTVEIRGKQLTMRDRLALRVIFAKIFVSQPEFHFVSPQWLDDPRAQGLAISQLEARDGWMAVAISSQDSPLAREVSQRGQLVKTRLLQANDESIH